MKFIFLLNIVFFFLIQNAQAHVQNQEEAHDSPSKEIQNVQDTQPPDEDTHCACGGRNIGGRSRRS